jgi:phospholipid/cholesterol/gamma-HCH transport system substrate-binding protein
VFKEKHYIAVGIFVILTVLAGSYFVYWLSGAREPVSTQHYVIHFAEPVRGLTRGSAVRYLGVRVGRVRDIQLNPDTPDHVSVIIDVQPNTPIRTNTEAMIQMQGITGLVMIALVQGPGEGRPMPAIADNGYPEIKARRSPLNRMLDDAPILVEQISQLTQNINRLFSGENVDNISALIANASQASQEVAPAMAELGNLLRESRQTLNHINAVAESMRKTSNQVEPHVLETMQSIKTTTRNLAAITGQVERMVEENRENLQHFMDQGLGDFSLLMNESRSAVQEGQRLVESLRQNPTQLIIQHNVERIEVAP